MVASNQIKNTTDSLAYSNAATSFGVGNKFRKIRFERKKSNRIPEIQLTHFV